MSTISTSGIAPSSVIRAEHVLRVINALSNVANNDILITGSLTVTGSTAISGSLNVDGGITGSIFGTATNATSASYALTSSYAISSSYEINYETSSSYAESATSASYALNSTNASSATSSSYALTASYALNSPGGGGTTDTGSLLLTASVTDNIITFTKGDASTFNITVNTGSASSINTGSFATTGSNQFKASQGITGSVDLNGGTFITYDTFSLMSIYPNIITIENLGSPFGTTLLGQGTLSYFVGSDTQHFLFPASLTGGTKTITLPNDTGTVALTYNTVTTSSFNSFISSYNNKTGSFATTGSNTFTGNQIVNANLTLTSSATMSIVIPGGDPGMRITKDQISINPNLFSDQATLSGGNLSLGSLSSAATVYLINQNPDPEPSELASFYFKGKTTDANSGFKGRIRANTVGGTGSAMTLNFYTSASNAFFMPGDLDMRISSGSSIELFRNTTVTGSVSITSVLTLSPNDPLPTSQPTGSISVSGSGADCKPYFYNGTDWTSMI